MNKGELRSILLNRGVSRSYYSLEGGLPNEKLCLDCKNGKWIVYYSAHMDWCGGGMGKDLRTNNIWESFEKGALMNDTAVNQIDIVDPKYDSTKIIYKK